MLHPDYTKFVCKYVSYETEFLLLLSKLLFFSLNHTLGPFSMQNM